MYRVLTSLAQKVARRPVVWFLLKVFGIIFLLMWVRWTLPRVRMDQVLGFAWKVLTPVALANLLISGWFMVWP